MSSNNHQIRGTTGVIIAMVSSLLAAAMILTGVSIPVEEAEAGALSKETLTQEMIDGFSMQVKPAEPEDSGWKDLDDGDHVSVYDTVRYKVDFHIPQGTLSNNNKTLTAYVKMNGSTVFPAYLCNPSEQYGNIMINGVESGKYSVRLGQDYYDNYPYYDWNNCSSTYKNEDGMYQMRLRVILTFNDEVVQKNQHMDITDGVLTFDQAAYYLADGVDEPTLSIGDSEDSVKIHLDKMHVDLSKETIGESHYDDATGLVLQKFRVTVKNDGDLDLPAGWKIGDTVFANDAPEAKTSSSGAVWSFGFTCAPQGYERSEAPEWLITKWWSNESYYGKNGCLNANASNHNYTWRVSRTQKYYSYLAKAYPNGYDDFYYPYHVSEYWSYNKTLKKGETMIYEYTGYTPYSKEIGHWTNRVTLNPNTRYYPEILIADAKFESPKDYNHVEKPFIETEKVKTANHTIDCRAGEEGCLERISWNYTIRNTGDGDQNNEWEVKDQLNYWEGKESGSNYSWFAKEDVDNLLKALQDQNLDAMVVELAFDNTHNLTQNNKDENGNPITAPPLEWGSFTSWDAVADRINNRDLMGYKIRVKTPIKAGQSVVIPYFSTAAAAWASESTSSSKTVRNYAQYCDDVDCMPVSGGGSTRVLSYPSVSKLCGAYSALKSKEYPSSIIGQCNVRLTVPEFYQGHKVFTFKEKMTPKTISPSYKGLESPKSFQLAGYTIGYSSAAGYSWSLDSPSEIGESTTKNIIDNSVKVIIRKDSAEDWTISFEILKDNAYYGDGQNYLNYYVYYREGDFDATAYDVTDAETNDRSIAMNNEVNALIGNKIDDGVSTSKASSDWGSRYYESDYVAKLAKTRYSNSPYGASGSRTVYRTGFNPRAADLNPNGDTIDFVDSITSTLPDGVTVNLDPSSVKVLTSRSKNDIRYRSGSSSSRGCWYLPGNGNGHSCYYQNYLTYGYNQMYDMSSTPVSDAVQVPVNSDQISYDTTTKTLKITGLPDDVRLWVEYALIFNSTSKDSHSINVVNSATLTQQDGSTINGMTTSSSNSITIYHSSAVANVQGIFFNKYDADDPSWRVGNAVYQLDEWNGKEWVKNRDVTTTRNGPTTIGQLTCGTAYRIYEVKAPAHYILDDTKYGFYLHSCGVESGLMPEGFKEDKTNQGFIVLDHMNVTDRHELMDPLKMPRTGQQALLWLGCGLAVLILGAGVLFAARMIKSHKGKESSGPSNQGE